MGSEQRDVEISAARCRFRSSAVAMSVLDDRDDTFRGDAGQYGPRYEEGPCQLLGRGSGWGDDTRPVGERGCGGGHGIAPVKKRMKRD